MEIYNDVLDLVSVIVPFFNGSQWLIEALQSVVNQTYTNWELIVFDDGSEELHSHVAREFCRQYPGKMLYAEHKGHVNRGVTISRNEAARFARGKYLAFLDADDVWLPQKLSNQLSCFTAHPEAHVVCNPMLMWYSWDEKNRHRKNRDYVRAIGVPHDNCYAAGTLNKILYPFTDAASPAPSTIMITKKAFDRIGGFEPQFSGIYELYEDQAFLSKVYLHEAMYVSGKVDILYRKRDNSMCSAANDLERYQTVRAFYFNWLENYLFQNGTADKELSCLIRKARSESIIAPVDFV